MYHMTEGDWGRPPWLHTLQAHLSTQGHGSLGAAPPLHLGLAPRLEAGLAVAPWRLDPHLDRKVKVPESQQCKTEGEW